MSMYHVSFSKDGPGRYIVSVSRNGFPSKKAGRITKQGPWFVLMLTDQGEYVPCETFSQAKDAARAAYA
jgi:hypothetical protein